MHSKQVYLKMIVITGAAGFIGSCLAGRLNRENFPDLVLVDSFAGNEKTRNYSGKKYRELVERKDLSRWIDEHHRFIQFVFHLGARTDTAEKDPLVFKALNLDYTKMIWEKCVCYGLPLVYASSAATYGTGNQGYSDAHENLQHLRPLNPYGESKHAFDLWALQQPEKPYFWAGLKFFNVYGPNEYHKDRMASVVFHAFKQSRESGRVKLFRSHHPDYEDGEQMRDFVYVMDVVEVMLHFMRVRKHSAIYNVGTGQAKSFIDLVYAVYRSMQLEPSVEYIDIPADIRDKYQYFTEAGIEKLRKSGFQKSFTNLQEGVRDYVQNFLMKDKTY